MMGMVVPGREEEGGLDGDGTVDNTREDINLTTDMTENRLYLKIMVKAG